MARLPPPSRGRGLWWPALVQRIGRSKHLPKHIGRKNLKARCVSSVRSSAPRAKHSLFGEAHQPLEQPFGILDIAGLARVIDAQGSAAEDHELLGRYLGIGLALELLPEILVGLAAIEVGLRRRRSCREDKDQAADRKFANWPTRAGWTRRGGGARMLSRALHVAVAACASSWRGLRPTPQAIACGQGFAVQACAGHHAIIADKRSTIQGTDRCRHRFLSASSRLDLLGRQR